jgi:hypothetical protein
MTVRILSSPWTVALVCTSVAAGCLYGLVQKSTVVWRFALIPPFLAVGLTQVMCTLWLGGDHVSARLMGGPFLWLMSIYLMSVVGAIIHLLTLGLYAALVKAPSETGGWFRPFFSAALDSGDRKAAWITIQTFMGVAVGGIVLVSCLALHLPIGVAAALGCGTPLVGWITIYHSQTIANWWLNFRSQSSYRWKTVAWAVGAPLGVALWGVLYWGFFKVLAWLADYAAALWGRFIVIGLLVLLFGTMVWILLYGMRTMLRVLRSPYPTGKFTPEEWIQKIGHANSIKQREILYRTNHQSLALTPQEFIEVLRRVEPSIRREPALSTYWAQRAEIEQALKQERHA